MQQDDYGYEDPNNYYHTENYRGQSRGRRPFRGQNMSRPFRPQNHHGRGQRNQTQF